MKRLRTLRSVLSLATGLLLWLAAGCSGGSPDGDAGARQDGTPSSGGTAVLGSISDVDSWNPLLSGQSFAANLHRRIFLPLASESGTGLDAEDGFIPQLAESWTFGDDGRSLTFNLRQATWSDGVPVTADDVRFTWEAQRSPDVPWQGAGSKARIVDVVVVNERTARFEFDGVYPYQLADAVEGGIVPEHVFGAVPFADWATHDWSTVRVGSGPFLLERHAARQEIVLQRNPNYFVEGLPYLDRVVIRVVPDILNLLTQLETGEIDYLEGIPPRDAARLEERPRGGIELIEFALPEYNFIAWNGAVPPFDDPEVRRAMTLAIDREAIVRTLLFGYGQVGRGPVPSASWGADPELVPWPYDPEQARQILRERGFAVREGDGTRTDGRQIRVELRTNGGNELRRDAMVLIQDHLSRVGVEIDLRPMEPRSMQQQVGRGEFDAVLAGWVFVGKIDLSALFHSRSTGGRGLNFVQYVSDEADALLEAIEQATTLDAMRPPWIELQRQIHRDQPYTFLFESVRIAGYGPRLHGVVIDLPQDSLANLERFWIVEP